MIKVFKNVLSQETLDEVIKYFHQNNQLWVHDPANAGVIFIPDPWKHVQHIIQPELLKHFKAEDGHSGTIYRHIWQYPIHVDCFYAEPMVNVLIPLMIAPEQEHDQKFVVFDQKTGWQNPKFWRLPESPDAAYKIWPQNESAGCRPCEDPEVYGCTDEPVDQEIYDAVATDTKEFFHGLTGQIIDYAPGDAIMFDSTHLHALGKMDSWKMGLAVHFWGSVETLPN